MIVYGLTLMPLLLMQWGFACLAMDQFEYINGLSSEPPRMDGLAILLAMIATALLLGEVVVWLIIRIGRLAS
jgi:hypothetical protein